MTSQGWFQKDKSTSATEPLRSWRVGPPIGPHAKETSNLAARLRPHELIAMLNHHYSRVRARSLPRVKITIAVSNPSGAQAVVIACG